MNLSTIEQSSLRSLYGMATVCKSLLATKRSSIMIACVGGYIGYYIINVSFHTVGIRVARTAQSRRHCCSWRWLRSAEDLSPMILSRLQIEHCYHNNNMFFYCLPISSYYLNITALIVINLRTIDIKIKIQIFKIILTQAILFLYL